MMQPWRSDSEESSAIAKIEATPETTGSGVHPKHEASLFKAFWAWLFPRLDRSADLAEAFGSGEVAQRHANARRTLEEASEIAAKRDLAEAKVAIQRQVEVTQFIANVDSIERLQTPAARAVAFAKLLEQNPGIMEQLDLIAELVSQLNLRHGLMISQISVEEQVARESLDRSSE